jgi:hypothetical protein
MGGGPQFNWFDAMRIDGKQGGLASGQGGEAQDLEMT